MEQDGISSLMGHGLAGNVTHNSMQDDFYVPHMDQMPSNAHSYHGVVETNGGTSVDVNSNSVQTYDEVFPALPPMAGKIETNGKHRTKIRPSVVTQVFTVAPEERKFKENSIFGQDQSKICVDIMSETNTKIEISSSKDGTLTFLITGKEDSAAQAKRAISAAVQTKAEKAIPIPKEHRKHILGKSGKKLLELEKLTGTKISVPKAEEESNLVKITGSKDGIEKAIHEILLISNEAASKANEVLIIPKEFHPFINGPFNETVNQVINETGAKINIPPNNSTREDILISGETNAVAAAKARVLEIYEEKKSKCFSQPIQMARPCHKYIFGPKGQTLQEIFRQTGVYVEMPPLDSSVDTVILRGEREKIGPALQLLYEKAHSVSDECIDAEAWTHKYIIGPKGSNFQELQRQFGSDVHVSFETEGKIKIHGPRNDVCMARQVLLKEVENIKKRISYVEIKVDPKYHRFIIGKGGAQVKQIRDATQVQVHVPSSENENTAGSDIIRLEGSEEGIKQAQEQLEAIISKQKERENEVSKELFIDHRFHRQLIGSKGENIKEIREKFNQVTINFPDSTSKSDKVTIRGSKDDVEKCYKYLAQCNKELLISNFRIEVPISKQCKIIGKERTILQKVRNDTGTKIEVQPNEGEPEKIIITGRKESVEKAKEQIQSLFNNYIQRDIIIPAKLHNSLIGPKGRLVKSISDDCGGVTIKFPQEGSGSDKVTLFGTREMVAKAKEMLLKSQNERLENSYTETVKAKPALHRYLIGKDGVNIKKMVSKDVKIIFPLASEEDESERETISIVGKKDIVQQTKAELISMIKELEKIVEISVDIPPKYLNEFKRVHIKQLKNEIGDITIMLNQANEQPRIILKGSKDLVEEVKKSIEKKLETLEAQVTITVEIPQDFHGAVIGRKKQNLRNIMSMYDVDIRFPRREANGAQEDMNGESCENYIFEKSDVITIKGLQQNCVKAQEALLASIPIIKEIEVPCIYHKYIIGRQGTHISELNEACDVSIAVPKLNEQSDIIRIQGKEENVEKAIEAINERVAKLDEEARDREARNFKVELDVDPAYHSKIIGKKGIVINKLRERHNVQIQFPEKSNKDNQDPSFITIIGYENNVSAAKDEIEKMVEHFKNLVTETVNIDNRVHRRLIGQNGKSIRKIMNDFNVEVKFPRDDSNDPDLVTITGERENIDNCIEHLRTLEEEYLDDASDQYTYLRKPVENTDSRPTGGSKGFYVKGAPWEQSRQMMPDTSNTEEFPSMCTTFNPQDREVARGWGRVRGIVDSHHN